MRIVLDPGHGGRNQNVGLNGYHEAEFALDIAKRVAPVLENAGHQVKLTRTEDVDFCTGAFKERDDLQARCDIAEAFKADFYLSIHSNASDNPSANGTETYCYRFGGKGETFARAIQEHLTFRLGTFDRGVKTAEFYVLRNTSMPAVLTEVAFHTNQGDVQILNEKRSEIAQAIAEAILSLAEASPTKASVVSGDATVLPSSQTPLLGAPVASLEQARRWAINHNASAGFVDRAELYYRLSPEHGNVRPDVAYADSAKETSFGHYTGVVPESYMNPGGLKTSAGGDNNDPAAHQKFTSWEQGVAAHLDHLALYAGAEGYPRQASPDPRHFPFIRGTAPTVEALGGKYAPDPNYGVSLVRDYLAPMINTPVPEPIPMDPRTAALEKQVSDLQAQYAELHNKYQALVEKLTRARDILGGV